MCCLKYEQDNYEQTRQAHAARGPARCITPDGVGVINAINVLEETVRVRIAVGDSFELREYPIDDCQRPKGKNANRASKRKIRRSRTSRARRRASVLSLPRSPRRRENLSSVRPERREAIDRRGRGAGARAEARTPTETGKRPKAAQKTDGQAGTAGRTGKPGAGGTSRFVNPNSRPLWSKRRLKPSMCWRSARTRSGKTLFKDC